MKLSENEGVVMQFPGNTTETDFREMLTFASKILREPSSAYPHQRNAVALALTAWALRSKVVNCH